MKVERRIPDDVAAAGERRVKVAVWDRPVRVTHWLIFFAVMVLTVTGLYMGTPAIQVGSDTGFLMGNVRAMHRVAAWVFTVSVLARYVWGLMGNRWARWDQFIPTTRERFRLMGLSLRYYAFLRREPPPVVGHNSLAGLTYVVVYAMFVVQIVTGFALAELPSRDGVLWAFTGWVFTLAPIPVVRLIHHMIMWLTLGFIVHHVYSAILVDAEEHSGLVSSIINGYKELPVEESEH